jgi:hypothetical protein
MSHLTRLATLIVLSSGCLGAQGVSLPPLLDALSISVQQDSATVARGSMRFRTVRTGNEVELVATGIVVRRGLRVTAELRSDTLFGLRKYVAESRDSAGKVIDRIQVTNAGGRIVVERVEPSRRMVREYLSQRNVAILDSVALVPFVTLAAMAQRAGTLVFVDVRRGTLSVATTSVGAVEQVMIADVAVDGQPFTTLSGPMPLMWWRDAKGRLLRVIYGGRGRIIRDDPPAQVALPPGQI